EVQRRCDRWRQQGLDPDAQDARDLAAHDRAERNQAGFAVHAVALSFVSIRRTNSSSSRFALLRIDVTVIPRADKAANSELRSCARDISASMPCSSTRVSLTPSTMGNSPGTAATS